MRVISLSKALCADTDLNQITSNQRLCTIHTLEPTLRRNAYLETAERYEFHYITYTNVAE